jgi:hypothetical protein
LLIDSEIKIQIGIIYIYGYVDAGCESPIMIHRELPSSFCCIVGEMVEKFCEGGKILLGIVYRYFLSSFYGLQRASA